MNPIYPQTFHLYGRKTYPQPLTFVGQLQIENATGLKDEALKLVGDAGWVELIAIPESSSVPVIAGERQL